MSATTTEPSAPILDVVGVSKRYGGIVAVDGVSFQVRRGIAAGLIGPNGAGKTTVFDLLTGFQRVDRGTIRFDGNAITNIATHKISKMGIGRTFQSVRGFGKLSVLDNIKVADAYGAGNGVSMERVEQALAIVEMEPHANKPLGSLSYGQRKLIELAMVLVQQPKLILLDEPVAGVNPGLAERLSDILSKMIKGGISLLLVEHNIRFVTGICAHVIVLAAARVLAEGSPDEIMKNAAVLEAFLGSDH